MAIEAPEAIRGVVSIAASMPSPDYFDCESAAKAVAVMFINGTEDRVNPFDGGEVRAGLSRSFGFVQSSLASAEFWAGIAGHESAPFQHRFPDGFEDDDSVATRMVWADAGLPEVSLITVHGGGHAIPHSERPFPRSWGGTNRDFSAAEKAWRFFERELERQE